LSDGYTAVFVKIYCCFVVYFGYYFLLNLILAVILQNFNKVHELEGEQEILNIEKEIEEIEKKRKQDRKRDSIKEKLKT